MTMPDRYPSTGRLLGWLYLSAFAAAIGLAVLSGGGWRERQETTFAGFLLLFLSGGFLLARSFYQQSWVFYLFYRFGRLQTSGGSPRDRCLMNSFILAMLGFLLLSVTVFGA